MAGKSLMRPYASSIAVFNENRRLVNQFYALRATYPWRIPAAEAYLLMRAGMLIPVEEHNQLLS